MTARALILALLFSALPVTATAGPITVETQPIALVGDAPDIKTIGKLRFRGGLVLRSDDNHFGGFSSLGVSADGQRMVSISDKGRRLAADLLYDDQGRLSGIANPALDTLSDLDGRALAGKRQSDAESMSAGVDGEIIVAFERNHRLWSYRPAETRPRPLQPPDELARMPGNGGIEALTLLNDGSLLAISEGPKGTSDAIAWVSDTQGWSVMTYATTGGFRVTGAATLADGDVLVLERRYTLRDGVAARLRRLDAKTIEPGARLQAELIAEFRPPITVDNFEGIETRRDAKGRTLVYIVSDDNFNPLQQTLLLMFELME